MEEKLNIQIKTLEAKKIQYFRRVQTLYDLSRDRENTRSEQTFLKKYLTLNETKELFCETVDRLNNLKIKHDENYEPNFEELNVFDELICEIEFFKNSLDDRKPKSMSVSDRKLNLKLPKLELNSFSGDLKEWPVFFETFRNIIHNNEHLSDVEKIQYLVGKLSGRALATIASIPPTENNYQIIWKALVDKYEDKRKLSLSYLNQMFNFRPIHSESSVQLDLFLDKFVNAYEALKQLNIDNLSDYIILYLASTKLDNETFKNFEMSEGIRGKDFPTFEEFVRFIKEQTKILDRMKRNINKPIKNISHSHLNSHPHPHSFFMQNKGEKFKNNLDKCSFCKKGLHQLYECEGFLGLSAVERHHFIKNEGRCFNCLSSVHLSPDCKSKLSCKICGYRHHSLLHLKDESEVPLTGVSLCGISDRSHHSILLSTAQIRVVDAYGAPRLIRVLLDSASQPNLITQRCCRVLGLKYQKILSSVKGMGGSSTGVLAKTTVSFTPHFESSTCYTLDFFVVNKIAERLPSALVNINNLPHLKNLLLADKNFYVPGEIDAIVGAELYASLLKNNKITDLQGSCVAVETTLGYVVMGRAPTLEIDSFQSSFHCFQEEPLESLVEKFWTLEKISEELPTSEEDKICENIFETSHSRDEFGRYVVNLPFKLPPNVLGDSFETAKRRFSYLEKRFKKSPELHEQYSQEIQKLIANGYLSISEGEDGYFIPHHAVYKVDSSSTPLRIVFDASAKTTSGYSLNDILYIGVKLQADIHGILLRFRLFQVAMTADVRQMYLRILVKEEHRKYQKIIWRFNYNEPLKIYHLNRVTFGISSSPFLAQRTVKQLALDESQHFSKASYCIPADMYVDDLVTSVSGVQRSIDIFNDTVALFKAGGFELVKWSTNHPKLLAHIPDDIKRSTSVSFDNQNSKVLGLIWNPGIDNFSFNFQPRSNVCTKRNILSTVARIFDPLGFLGPVLLYAKCIIKELWQRKLDWDTLAPVELAKNWQLFNDQLPNLASLKIPRHVNIDENVSVWLIGFCDGSKKGYGAVIYSLARTPNGLCEPFLFCAKSRVAPLNNLFTTPRSELSGAVLLSKLLHSTWQAIKTRITVDKIFALTDSTITLHRIKSNAPRGDVFVKNRIAKIRETTSIDSWFHIPTYDNPADCLSRGLLPQQLIKSTLWWQGPSWLKENLSCWPLNKTVEMNENEEVSQCLNVVTNEVKVDHPLLILASRCSSWQRLLRSVVFVLRFIRKLESSGPTILPTDLEKAEHYLICAVQKKHFGHEISQIQRDRSCGSILSRLQPFLHDGLLRVGGRLKYSDLKFNQKHPILLPKSDFVTALIIKNYHERFLHAGSHLLISLLRQKYWILSARNIVRKIVRNCNICFRINPKPIFPIMGDLPACRVRPSTAFAHTGVDYAGPFSITLKRGRGQKSQKAYLCLFVCLSTKALHLEIAPDLTTESFLNAFKRFISRRGQCEVLYSDRGTNFVGAKGILHELYNLIESENFKSKFRLELNAYRIIWKFIPPSAPHFGGLWESNIKSVKTHLKRIVGCQILSLDEFMTIITQIEALLNSRPLTVLSEDPSELSCLTPAHFLIGRPLQSLPSLNASEVNFARCTRPELLNSMVQGFWKRWHLEYLHTLQNRRKWDTTTPPITEGTIALIIDENAPPLTWLLCRVTKVYPGKDGVTRVAQVKTKKGTYIRPVIKLCPLPSQ